MREWPFPMHDPYPAHRAARERAPVQYATELDAVLVLSRAAATRVLRDPAWSSDPRTDAQTVASVGTGAADQWARSMLLSDGEAHARLRSVVTRFFTPCAADRIRARVAAIVDVALEPLRDGESIDVMAELAYPVPVTVIAELFDIGLEGAQLVRDETPDLARMLEAFPSQDDLAAAAAAVRLMLFLVPLVAKRRDDPGNDLLSALIASGLDTDDDVITTTVLLVAAGHETTANLIGTGALVLLKHPDALAALQARPQLAASVVEEILRYDSPVQATRREAAAPVTLDGALPAVDGLGDPQVSWLVEAGGRRVLHLGDTVFHGAWWQMARRAGPFDVVFTPVNGAVIDFPHQQPARCLRPWSLSRPRLRASSSERGPSCRCTTGASPSSPITGRSSTRASGSSVPRAAGPTDVNPTASQRTDFGLKCRLYSSAAGLRGTVPDELVLFALTRALEPRSAAG